MKSEELKQTAQLRKAIAPLVSILKKQADEDLIKRLDTLEALMKELAERDNVVNVSQPDINVTVEVPEELKRMVKNSDMSTLTAYEPHDQAKKGVFQYSGFLRSDGNYYIQRVAKGEQRYAKGKSGYKDAWDNKETLTYLYIDGE